jgi:hypothetical protein
MEEVEREKEQEDYGTSATCILTTYKIYQNRAYFLPYWVHKEQQMGPED